MSSINRRWHEIEPIVDRLLRAPPEERAALLDENCGDDAELQAAVEAVLEANRQADALLARPAARDGDWGTTATRQETDTQEETAETWSEPSARTPETAPVDRVGTRVGPYRLDERLGSGGMGEVYRAFDLRLERTVALKRVRLGAGQKARVLRRRFRREAKLAARLAHPGIVGVYDLFEAADEDWLVMELLEGQTLAERLVEGPLPCPRPRPWSSDGRSPRPWPRPTTPASCTGISRPRTCW